MQALQFPRGKVYQIICKAGDQALKIQQTQTTKYNKSRVVGTQPNVNDISQLFMIQKVGMKDDQFQFVNYASSLVFDEQSKQIRLKVGKQSSDQLFAIVQAPINAYHKYYWIKTDLKGKTALSFQGILRYVDFDSNKQSQLFRFQQVSPIQNPILKQSALIINSNSGKALDVPSASYKQGQRIVQWKINNRSNQRWIFYRKGNSVIITSLFNKLSLDISQQKRQSGSKVIQYRTTGQPNQLWIPIQTSPGIYRFQSVHETSLYLGIKKSNIDDGGQLQVTSDNNNSTYWRLDGVQL